MTTRTAKRPKVAGVTGHIKWRNRWRALVAFDFLPVDVTRYPGEEYDGECLHPSKDVAETVAAESIAHCIAQIGYAAYEYLGAFPVEAP